MAVFLRNVSFHGILLDALFEPGNPDWQPVYDLVTEGLTSGVVQPLSTTVYELNDVENAFRFMAQGKHVGKVLIKVRIVYVLNLSLTKVKNTCTRRSRCNQSNQR